MTRYEVELTDEQAREFEETWPETGESRRAYIDSCYSDYALAAYALADAIRANPPKPPRMDEPTEYGARVRSARGGPWASDDRCRHVRWTDQPNVRPWMSDDGLVASWDELLDPEPLGGAL